MANTITIDKDKLVEIICDAVMSEIGVDHNKGYDVADKVIDEIDKIPSAQPYGAESVD